MPSVIIELAKLALVGTRITYQATGDAGMICNAFLVVFWGTLLRPTAGAVVLTRKCTTLQNVPWLLCANIQEASCPISS